MGPRVSSNPFTPCIATVFANAETRAHPYTLRRGSFDFECLRSHSRYGVCKGF